MSDVASMAVGVVVGGAIASSYTKTMRTAEERAHALGERWREANKRLKAVGDVVRYRGELERLRKKQAGAAVSSERLDRGVRDLERRYREAKRELKSYGLQVGDAVRDQRRLQRELRATGQAARGLDMRTKAAGRLRGMRNLAVGAAGAAYGVGRMLGSGMEREEQALYLRTVINAQDGDKDAAVGRAVAAAREQVRTSLASESEILEIEYALNSAGLDEQTARAGTELVHRVAKVTRGSGQQVGEIVGGVLDNMGARMAGTTQEKLQHIGDVLAKTQFRFAFRDFGQLGEGLAEAAAGAKIAQMGLGEMAAAVGVLNNAQMTGSRAGTALNAVLRNLQKAGKELGTEVVRDDGGALDLVGTLAQIKEKTDAMDADTRQETFQKLFGDEGVKGIAPLVDGIDAVRDGIAALAASGGTVQEAYRPFLESASGQWTTMKNRVRSAGDALAQNLLPAVTSVVGHMAEMASFVGSAIEQWPWLSKAIVGAGIGLVVVTGALVAWNAGAWLGGAAMSMWAARTKVADGAMWAWTKTTKAGTAAAWVYRRSVGASTWAVDGLGAGVAATARRLPFLRAGLVGGGGAFRVFGVGAAVASKALRVFRIALISTGVGAIVVGIGMAIGWLVAHWDGVKAFFRGFAEGIGGVLDALGPVGRVIRAIGSAIKTAFGWLGRFFSFDPVEDGNVGKWEDAGKTTGAVAGALIRRMLPGFASKPEDEGQDAEVGNAAANAPNVGDAIDAARRESPRKARRAGAATAAAAGAAFAVAEPPPLPPRPAPALPPAVSSNSAAPAAAARSPATVTVHVGDIVIHPPPGADAAEIAAIVHRELAAALRRGAVEAGLSESD